MKFRPALHPVPTHLHWQGPTPKVLSSEATRHQNGSDLGRSLHSVRMIRIPSSALSLRVACYFGDRKRDPNVENCPLGVRLQGCLIDNSGFPETARLVQSGFRAEDFGFRV